VDGPVPGVPLFRVTGRTTAIHQLYLAGSVDDADLSEYGPEVSGPLCGIDKFWLTSLRPCGSGEFLMNLSEFVVSGAILPNLEAVSKEDAVRAMVGSLKDSGAIPAEDEEGIVAAILKREELGSTGIGNGVAVPHTKHPSVDRLVATVAISSEGVDFASLDGESVFILFLLVSPPDRPGDHLRGLENISRHLRDQTFCNFLRQSKTVEDVVELLDEADNRQV